MCPHTNCYEVCMGPYEIHDQIFQPSQPKLRAFTCEWKIFADKPDFTCLLPAEIE